MQPSHKHTKFASKTAHISNYQATCHHLKCIPVCPLFQQRTLFMIYVTKLRTHFIHV